MDGGGKGGKWEEDGTNGAYAGDRRRRPLSIQHESYGAGARADETAMIA